VPLAGRCAVSERVVETPWLPSPPSDRELARRIVRHGLADVLTWLGEDVGPKPTDQTHVIRTPDALFVSSQVYEQLRTLPRGKTVSWDVPLTRTFARSGDYSGDVGTDTSGDLKGAQIGADVIEGDDA
jgi:hypothetical protein